MAPDGSVPVPPAGVTTEHVEAAGEIGDARVVRVLPDVAAISKEFDYLVPEGLAGEVRIGTMVRIDLHGRRVGGWVVADGVTPPPAVTLRPLAKVTGWGPPADVVDLTAWAAWRWAGPRSAFLKTASPDRAVRGLPHDVGVSAAAGRAVVSSARGGVGAGGGDAPSARGGVGSDGGAVASAPGRVGSDEGLIAEALAEGRGKVILRLPPAHDVLPVVEVAARRGPVLVVTPSTAQAAELAARLRRAGTRVALVPGAWAQAVAGADVVIGARAAAWAPCPGLRA
ncbi:MAG TPA: hypothetical protein VKQ71_04765, partial [Acidimicrobiales bacterium]|nr:hypothetical protein [Acidimicrobiales bacterium]